MARVLVLANSKKLNGRCVAGIDLKTGAWVRPVGASSSGELVPTEYRVAAGNKWVRARFGQVIDAPLGASRASAYHPEDVAIAGPWRLLDTWSSARILTELSDSISTVSAPLGTWSDRLSLGEIRNRVDHSSLQLVNTPRLRVYDTTSMRGNLQVRGSFSIGDRVQDHSLTDVSVETDLARRGEFGRSLLTISLTEPFPPHGSTEEYCFKVIAAAVPVEG